MGGKIHHTQGRGHGKGHPVVVALLIALVTSGIMYVTQGFGLFMLFESCTSPQPTGTGYGTTFTCDATPGLILITVVIPLIFGVTAYVLLTRVRETSPGREIGARRNRMLGGRQ